jgi:WD40 repeat protein
LATTGGFAETTIHLWDTVDGRLRGSLSGHAAWIPALRFSPDGRQLASGSQDQTVRLWDPGSMEQLAVLRGHTAVPFSVEYTPDGKTLISASADYTVLAWDANPSAFGGGPTIVAGRTPLRRLAFSSDGTKLFVPLNGVVQSLDTTTWATVETYEDLGGGIGALALSRAGRLLATGDDAGRIKIWDLAAHRLAAEWVGHAGGVVDVAFLRGDGELVSVTSDFEIKRWSTSDWKSQGAWSLPTAERSTRWSLHPDQRLMAVLNEHEGTVKLFNLRDGTVERVLNSGKSNLFGVCFSPDGRLFVTGGGDSVVRIWSTQTWQQVHSVKTHLGGVLSVAFSPDGRRLVTGGSGFEAVKIFDVATWQELMTLKAAEPIFRLVDLAPPGRALLAISSSNELHVWPTPTIAQIDSGQIDP